MGIIEISDVESAYGQAIDSEDEATVQYYIDIVTAYLEDYTGLSFSEVIDDPVVCRSDRDGVIEFNELISVSSVEELDLWAVPQAYSTSPSDSYTFDGLSTIYGLHPYSTYRLTVSYGYVVAPDSIKGIAADLVLAGSGLDPSAAQGLVKKRVGDREEQYGISGAGNSVSLTSIQSAVLDKYRGTAWTIRT